MEGRFVVPLFNHIEPPHAFSKSDTSVLNEMQKFSMDSCIWNSLVAFKLSVKISENYLFAIKDQYSENSPNCRLIIKSVQLENLL